MAEQVFMEATSKKTMKSYSSTILVVCTRELMGYVANVGTIFHQRCQRICHDYIPDVLERYSP